MIELAVIAAAELVLIAYLVWQHQRTLQALCQRLQAPGAAVLAYDEQTRSQPSPQYAPPAVDPDSDSDFWVSRDELAEYAMREELNGDSAT